MLEHYRASLGFRRQHATLRDGEMTQWHSDGQCFSFLRRGDETLFCAFNLSDTDTTVTLPAGTWTALAETLHGAAVTDGVARLSGWGFVIAKRS